MAATHKGHCQICGSLQKLPKGHLSLHGYTVDYGFFNGVCPGARALSFEQSTNLIAARIDAAKASLAHVEAFQAQLRTRPSAPVAWLRVYVPIDARGRKAYRWQEIPVTATEKHYDSYQWNDSTVPASSYWTFTFQTEHMNRPQDVPYVGHGCTDVLEACQRANCVYADWLEHEADSLRRYIAWQEHRVATWTEQPLIPVDVKRDDAAFVPTAPKY